MFMTNAQAMEVGSNVRKVNNQGHYKPYPGITVVADISDSDRAFFAELYELVKGLPDFTDFYALLPVSSYHMTTNNLFTKHEYKQAWKSFVDDNLPKFKDLNLKLIDKAFQPKVKLEKIIAKKTVKIILKLDSEHSAIISRVGQEHGVADKIPPVFHLTLGYLYKDISGTKLQLFQNQLAEALPKLLEKYHYPKGRDFLLQQPKLRYFNTMMEFIPWDAKSNPF